MRSLDDPPIDERDNREETPPALSTLPAHLTNPVSETFSDVTVVCKEKEFRLHKSMLCVRSGWFRAALTGGFEKAKSNRITLPEDLADVERMITWIYTSKYDDATVVKYKRFERNDPIQILVDCDGCEYSDGSLVRNAIMYGLGDKYQIPDLKYYARDKFKARLELKDALCTDYFKLCHKNYTEDLQWALRDIYRTTPPSDRGLRQLINYAIAENIEVLFETDIMADVMVENRDLCSNLLEHIRALMRPVQLDKTAKTDALINANRTILKLRDMANSDKEACANCGNEKVVRLSGSIELANMVIETVCTTCPASKKSKLESG